MPTKAVLARRPIQLWLLHLVELAKHDPEALLLGVPSDESQAVWKLFNMTHILPTNSNTAGPVVMNNNSNPSKT